MDEATALERHGDAAVKAGDVAEWRDVLEPGEVDLGASCVAPPKGP